MEVTFLGINLKPNTGMSEQVSELLHRPEITFIESAPACLIYLQKNGAEVSLYESGSGFVCMFIWNDKAYCTATYPSQEHAALVALHYVATNSKSVVIDK